MRQEDHQLQVVYFGGRYFIEGMLTFGGMNSPAIYNLPASYLIQLAHKDSKLDRRQSIQQLDDNCAADALGSELLKRYYVRYREIATRIGVSLAGEENNLASI